MVKPLLILSDGPTATTGLGRIARDLALRIAGMGSYRVGTYGLGGAGSRELPFPQYAMTNVQNWCLPDLPAVWRDFAGAEDGVLLAIWDASRLWWLPQMFPKRPFKLWGYFPMDAEGPMGKAPASDCVPAFDRAICYSKWSAGVMERTFGKPFGYLPHGIDTAHFYRRPDARRDLGQRLIEQDAHIEDDHFVVGIVATNQHRKDFGTALAAVHLLTRQRKVRLWIHTDEMVRYWHLEPMVREYGLAARTTITTGELSDGQLAQLYSACDVTLGIGLGEGFGYPIFESMACGTPCVHVDYAGAAEWLPDDLKITPVAWRVEGLLKRPVTTPEQWVDAMLAAPKTARLPDELDWRVLWPRWREWIADGEPMAVSTPAMVAARQSLPAPMTHGKRLSEARRMG